MENENPIENPQDGGAQMNQSTELPNSTGVLVLGICSIVFGCGGIGLVLGIIGIVMSKKGRTLYKANPNQYTDYGKLNAGYICSIIGLVLGALAILYYIVFVLIFGAAIFAAASSAAATQM